MTAASSYRVDVLRDGECCRGTHTITSDTQTLVVQDPAGEHRRVCLGCWVDMDWEQARVSGLTRLPVRATPLVLAAAAQTGVERRRAGQADRRLLAGLLSDRGSTVNAITRAVHADARTVKTWLGR